MILRLKKQLWEKRILTRFSIPDYSYAKRRCLFTNSFPCITTHFPEVGQERDNTLLLVVTTMPANLRPANPDKCSYCASENKHVINHREGTRICTSCATSTIDTTHEYGSYSQSFGLAQSIGVSPVELPRKHSDNVYKRCNHLKNWLNRLQGKERSTITRHQMENIMAYITQHRIVDLDYHTMQDILRHLGYQKLYLNIYNIVNSITGKPKFQLSKEHEEIIISKFMQMQEAYAKFTPRANMLSYVYLITKFVELLGWRDMALELPRFKSQVKLQQADNIWKNVCTEMGWEFIPSQLYSA